MLKALHEHWPEYLMEAAGLGIFMISAGFFATVLEYPGSPARQAISDPTLRRILMGVAMGTTAIGIIYSPWGKQSGAHINPAVTLTFFRLRKIDPRDAFLYIVAQFLGGLAGMMMIALALRPFISDPAVNFVATVPGPLGKAIALMAEIFISGILIVTILIATNNMKLARFTGVFAGILVALYIVIEAPISGMSMNPARSFASALPARLWTAFWIYLIAPPIGMLLGAEFYLRFKSRRILCAKLHHQNDKRCIFHCGFKNNNTEEELAKSNVEIES